MNWKHVHLIFMRELNDQLRDRRTLFTITVLPLLLYPLLGMLMMQMAQFNREHLVRVRVVGINNWPATLPLLDRNELSEAADVAEYGDLIEFESSVWPSSTGSAADTLEDLEQRARQAVYNDEVDAVLLVEPNFVEKLRERQATSNEAATGQLSVDSQAAESSAVGAQATDTEPEVGEEPSEAVESASAPRADGGGLRLIANLARDNSKIAQVRLENIIEHWRRVWVAQQLKSAGLNPELTDPLFVTATDTAAPAVKKAMLWSKVLPFVMLVWALTGAFYPAVDLCAGEKERGTLETLLSSPARRREIVWGKLLTISVFSVGSALLNLMSMHMTASIVVSKLTGAGNEQLAQAMGPMPIQALGWLILLLLPMAAFFSALALAVAALARSTKEGQYYLMPLLFVTLPLVALPMLPSLEMNLGTSLVPVSGAIFLVRSLIEGRYADAVIHLPVVLLVTGICCAMSLRWAIRQFESESVMFRESDRWNLRLWIHQLWRDRGDTASPTEAVMCGAFILVAMFFAQFMAGSTIYSWHAIVQSTVVVQLALILTPCLLMAIFLTRSVRRALRIHRTQPSHVAAAVLLGLTVHPLYLKVGEGIKSVYQIAPEMEAAILQFQTMVMQQPWWAIVLILAVLPALCEELAFRGFIFGGLLRHSGALRAIIVSALFFGFTHTLLQQSIAATMMGLLLGLIAWRTGGVICTIIVHVINNTLSLTLAWCSSRGLNVPSGLRWMISAESGEWQYQAQWITISIVLALALLVVLFRRSRGTQQVVQAEMA